MSHPFGEEEKWLPEAALSGLSVDTFGGKLHVEWDPQAAVTPLGQLPFFIEFLKLGGLFEPWVEDCPLYLTSPNASSKRDLLGTLLLSILSGHQRYSHMTSLRADGVNPRLLGMSKVVSEDALRRALIKIDEEQGVDWLQRHLGYCYEPLLCQPWILDVDATVKPLYGHQEGAEVGYNPQKPGRPSHTYHSYMIANLRLLLDVEVQSGKHSASKYSAPGLWDLLGRIPRTHWPAFIRGDCGWGTDAVMMEAESRGADYLFKLRSTAKVKQLIEHLMGEQGWSRAGQGWEGIESPLQLGGWEKRRRVVVLRRRVDKEVVVAHEDERSGQVSIVFAQGKEAVKVYEYAVLVTSLSDEILAIAQHYRDRGDCENHFDELKNHWGWGGFTTHDIKRCRLLARSVALIYNWWSLFVRLAHPDQHTEAMTSRPLLLHAVGRQTEHSGQTTLRITSTHGKADQIRLAFQRISIFFSRLKTNAEQLTQRQRWARILETALVKYLRGRSLQPPILALSSP